MSSSVAPFSFCLQSFPASGSFSDEEKSQLLTSAGQSIGASALAIVPFNENSGLISFRIDWFDLLAVQVTLKSLLQHHSLKAPILHHSAGPAINLSLLQTPTFLFVWTHHVLGTGTCTNNVCWPMFDMPLIPLPEDAKYPFIW